MPAAVVKGIIVSISIITALGIAVLENPQVQEWLEDQRRKLAEILRSIGEELDPESRRAAEAFAFEGKTPSNDEGLRRELSGSKEAAALATGRSLSSAAAVRRIPIQGAVKPDEAEERRRKGREYLALRNKQMYEMEQRRRAAKAEGSATSTTPTSFEPLVDEEGKLKASLELPSPPTFEPVSKAVAKDMQAVEQQLNQPILAGTANPEMSAFQTGASFADPLSDLQRSETPRPPVPPKVKLGPMENKTALHRSRASASPAEAPQRLDGDISEELSYEEQLAIALSLSEAETPGNAATVRQREPEDDEDFRAAIAASLRDMDVQQATHAVTHADQMTPQPSSERGQPLVDLTPSSSSIPFAQSRDSPSGGRQLSPSESALVDTLHNEAEASGRFNHVTRDVLRAGCIFFSCRRGQTPRAFRDVEELTGVPKKDIGRAWKLLESFSADRENNSVRSPQPVPVTSDARDWATIFDHRFSPSHEPFTVAQPSIASEDSDELYRATPQLTRARLASLDAQRETLPLPSYLSSMPYDPVREAAETASRSSPQIVDASFYSAPTSVSPQAAETFPTVEALPQLIDVSETPSPPSSYQVPTQTPRSELESLGFQTDSESDTFTSVAADSMPVSRAQSRPESALSGVDVLESLDNATEVDVLSEEGDGVMTPDSWTEVGSRDGEESDVEGRR